MELWREQPLARWLYDSVCAMSYAILGKITPVTWRGAESQYAGWLDFTRSNDTKNAYICERQEGCERYSGVPGDMVSLPQGLHLDSELAMYLQML